MCMYIYIYILSIIKPLLDHFHYSLTSFIWLVVSPPLLKNMSPSVGMMKFPIIWTKKNDVPNHQPENIRQQVPTVPVRLVIHIHPYSWTFPNIIQNAKPLNHDFNRNPPRFPGRWPGSRRRLSESSPWPATPRQTPRRNLPWLGKLRGKPWGTMVKP